MQKNMPIIKMNIIHTFGSTCSKLYKNCITICDEDKNQPKIVFPSGKTLARKYIDRQQMDFVHFSPTAQHIQCISILPGRNHVAVAQKLYGQSSQVIRIYNIRQKQQQINTIKIFPDFQKTGIITGIVFSTSQPQFMCCSIGQPHNKLIYIDTSKNKPLAESNFLLKDIQKVSICPTNSHLICVSGLAFIKLFKVQQYAFKPLDDIKKLPKNRKITQHSWYKKKSLLIATDKNQILLIQQNKYGYQLKQQYHNVFNQDQIDNMFITNICTFSKGFILGSSTGKFCLWIRKQDANSYQEEENLQLVRKWGTTQERSSSVTCINISAKQDILAISLANNDIATLYVNQLLPQVRFHNAKITGMDLCLQRPLLATCSREDSTIRIWNYKNFGCKLLRMFYYKMKDNPKDDRPLITLSFHPSGYYLAVGCSDKLRMFHVLNSQLRPYRQIPIRNAHIVQFSHGGHLLAACYPARQDMDGDIVKIYNSLTLQEIVSMKDHNSIIKCLQWKEYDQCLCTLSVNNLIQWKVSDWSKNKHITQKQIDYQFLTYNHTNNSILIFGKSSNKLFLQQHNCQTNNINSIDIDMKVINMQEIRKGKQNAIILALQNGSMITFGGLNNPIIMDRHNNHIGKITKLKISSCGNYLISVGQDALLFIYSIYVEINGVVRQQQNHNTTVDDFLADVVLLPKQQIQRYKQKQKQYSQILNGLTKKLKQASNQNQKKYLSKFQEIQIQKNRVIDDYKFRIQRIKQQIIILNKKNQDAVQNLDYQNLQMAKKLQNNYQEKLKFQNQKYYQLEQQIIKTKLLHQKQINKIKKQQQQKILKFKQQFNNKLKNSQYIYRTSKDITSSSNQVFQERLKQIEIQQEDQIRQIKDKRQKFKQQTTKNLQQLHVRLQRLKRQYQKLIKQKQKVKDQKVEDAKQKLKELNNDFEEKIKILNTKQNKIMEFQNKVIDLQKNKHILSYKATQMRKAIQPKQFQIDKLKQDLLKLKKQFELALQKKQRQLLLMQKLQKQRIYSQKAYNEQIKQTQKVSTLIDQIVYQIHNCIKNQNNEDPKHYLRQFIKLYHKYVQKNYKKIGLSDPKGIEQMTKQIVYLEKSLFQINTTNQKIQQRKKIQSSKKAKENSQLLNTLNQIKKQNQQLILKIRAKKLEIEKVRNMKIQMMAQCKKNNIKIYQEDNYNDSSSINQSKVKVSAIDTISKGDSAFIDSKISYQKKQNQLISQIEFIGEKNYKIDFFTQEIKEKIKKHFTLYKCEGQTINESDIEQI